MDLCGLGDPLFDICAIQGAYLGMKATGGKLLVFQTGCYLFTFLI